MPVFILTCFLAAVADAISLRAGARQETLDCACDGHFAQGQLVTLAVASASPPVHRGDTARVVAAYSRVTDRWPLLVDIDGLESGHGSCAGVDCGSCTEGGTSYLWVGCHDVVANEDGEEAAGESEGEGEGHDAGHGGHESTTAGLAFDVSLVTVGFCFTCFVSRRKTQFLQAMSDNVELKTMVRNVASEECAGLAVWLYKARMSEYYPQAAKLAHEHYFFELEDLLEMPGIEAELGKALAGEIGLLRSVTRTSLHAALVEFNELPGQLALEAAMGEDTLYRLSLSMPDEFLHPTEAVNDANLARVLESPRALLRVGDGVSDPFVRVAKTTLMFLEACVGDAQKWDLDAGLDVADQNSSGSATQYEDALSKIRIQAQADFARVGHAVQELRKRIDPTRLKFNKSLFPGNRVDGTAKRMHELYSHGVVMKKKYFNPLIYKLAVKLPGLAIQTCPLKGVLRALEKVALRPKEGMPWDVVRGQVVCTTMTQIVQVLSIIAKTSEVVILQVVDRFAAPQSGWADICLYLSFRDPKCDQVVGEIQIVHEKLEAIREKDKSAPEAYAANRFAAELKKSISQDNIFNLSSVPWSQR